MSVNNWTTEQRQAIEARNQDILVAAAAGSGKTAVLVERIIRRITDAKDPVNVDELLIATFTKAAAAEMKDRIRDALEKEAYRNPDNAHIRRQLSFIHRATISTLHAFCKDVIQRHHQAIDLDPGFRIANETEAALIRQDVLDDLMELRYGSMAEGDAFWSLVEWFGGERDDEALFRLIQKLYDASRSHPNPDGWLMQMAEMFEGSNAGNAWFESLLDDVRLELQSIKALIRNAIQIATSPGGPLPYLDNLQTEFERIQAIEAAAESWEALYDQIQINIFDRLKPCKKDAYDETLIARAKDYRDAAKKAFEKLKEELFERTPDQFRYELSQMAPVLRELAELVTTFAARYQEAKREKNLVDFSDLEHLALKVLAVTDESGRLLPSPAALSYQKQFKEVLVDEYQDINRVQEAILSLISRQDPGNRFMVGDVKQSIYRFRLADPSLFLEKYTRYPKDGSGNCLRIDLSRNFRSRREIVHAANFVFRQIMSERVGEILYNSDAELVYGAGYPEELSEGQDYTPELILIDRSQGGVSDGPSIFDDSENGEEARDFLADEMDELEPARLEAKAVAQQIKKLMGQCGGDRFLVYDKKLGDMRPVTYRDMVVLMRSPQASASVFIEELKQQGIPAYAEQNTGYFTATEVETMLSLLQVIDNPYQDIPLAAVLRSPIVGINAEDLAQIRGVYRRGDFYEAVLKYVGELLPSEVFQIEAQLEAAAASEATMPPPDSNELARILKSFLTRLEEWRTAAREGALSDLIWRIYRETGYYDFVGGLPGGVQRQANLKALYDRARQYEATSFRGLFRFLRFIERMRESGSDLGTANAIGEQEDVVRVMSIHKSKGLEFPVVFIAGLAKPFNQQDLNGHFLIHRELGYGPKYMDTDLRVIYPSLSSLAIKRRLRMEMLAEEMRILYVAMTRPREKVYLIAAVRNLEQQIQNWSKHVEHPDLHLPDFELSKANSYLDWIGPALIRHPNAEILRNMTGFGYVEGMDDPSQWKVQVIGLSSVIEPLSEEGTAFGDVDRDAIMGQILNLQPVHVASSYGDEINRRLNWEYPQAVGTKLLSKTSVTELKRFSEVSPMGRIPLADDGWEPHIPGLSFQQSSTLSRRPRFLEADGKLPPAERGTVYHTIMQNLPFDRGRMTVKVIKEAIQEMIEKRLLTVKQADTVDVRQIAQFFRQGLGKRILAAKHVMREVPFCYGLKASDIYPDVYGSIGEETILIQGVIDCLFEEKEGFVLLDYKTDSTKGKTAEELIDRYRLQLNLYSRAIEDTLNRVVASKYLYFFDGGLLIEVN
jgi:ATP-dependent helicase/nuclease subunit A